MNSFINREEIRRLEKAAREKDKKHLSEWAKSLEYRLSANMQKYYEKIYQDELANAIDTFLLTIIYTLYNDSNITIKKGKVPLFLDNLLKSVDRFRTGEAKKEDYEHYLTKDNIQIKDYHYQHRITDIVVVVATDENKTKKEQFIEELKAEQVIVLELDNTLSDNESQIHKNISMINMCTRMYMIGTNDTIEKYIQVASNANKPVMEVCWNESV